MTESDDHGRLDYVFGPLRAQPAPRWRAHAHARGIVDLAIVGETAITLGGIDEELACWDVATGTGLERIRLAFQPRHIACSPDGRHLAVGSALDDGIEVWPRENRTKARLLPSERTTETLLFPRSELLLVVDGIVTAWRLADEPHVAWRVRPDARIERLQHAVLLGDEVAVLSVAIDDRRATIDVHRLADGALVRSVEVAEPFERNDLDGAFVLAPAGDAIAWGHAYGHGEVRIIDLADGHTRVRMAGPAAGVGRIAWTDTSLVIGFADGSTREFDPATGAPRGSVLAHAGWVAGLAILPDGDWLTGGSDGVLQRWHTAAFADPAVDTVRAEAIFAIGGGELLALDAATIARRPFDAPGPRWSAPRPKGGSPRIACPPDRRWIAVAQTNPRKSPSLPPQSTCVAIDGDSGEVLATWSFAGEVQAAVHVDGRCFVATRASSHFPDSDRPLVVLEPGTEAPTRLAAWGHGYAHALTRAPADGPLVVALNDGRIATLATSDGRVIEAANEHHAPVTALVCAEGGALLSIAREGSVRIWQLDPLASPRGFAAQSNPRGRFEVVPHALVDRGRALAIGTGLPVLEIFDLASAAPRRRIELSAPLAALAAAPVGDWMAAALQDGTVLVLSPDGESIGGWTLPGAPRQLVVTGDRELVIRDGGGRLHGLMVR